MGDVLSAAGTSPEAVETAENALSCLDCLLKLPSPPAVLYKYELMVGIFLYPHCPFTSFSALGSDR